MTVSATALARAKINFTLEIEGVRDDGLHLLDSLVCSISLADRVVLTTSQASTSTLDTGGADAGPDTLNLALKAAALFKERFGGPNFDIVLDKQIPIGAGLGGGSADAAAVLVLANLLSDTGADLSELQAIGAQLGADVPFCVTGGLARMRGIGDEVAGLEIPDALLRASIVLATPGFPMPTAEVYAAWDRAPAMGAPDTLPEPLRGIAETFANDLEPAAEALVPDMRRLRHKFAQLLGGPARMTGSGSAFFGFAHSPEHAAEVASKLRRHFELVWVCSPELECIAIGG